MVFGSLRLKEKLDPSEKKLSGSAHATSTRDKTTRLYVSPEKYDEFKNQKCYVQQNTPGISSVLK